MSSSNRKRHPGGARRLPTLAHIATLEDAQSELERVREQIRNVDGRAPRVPRGIGAARPVHSTEKDRDHNPKEPLMPKSEDAPRIIVTTKGDGDTLSRRRRPRPSYGCFSATRTVFAGSPKELAALSDQLADWVIILAERDTPLQPAIERLCHHAWDIGVVTLLLRRLGEGPPARWSDHPANVVADVSHSDWLPTLALVDDTFGDSGPRNLVVPAPLRTERWARLSVLHGDPRRIAFELELAFRGILCVSQRPLRFGEAGPPGEGEWPEGVAFELAPLATRPMTSELHPLTRQELPHDPRCYASGVEPADSALCQAELIAPLHVAHGNWSLTRALIDECSDGDAEHQLELVEELVARLDDPRFQSYADLCMLAARPRPGPALRPTWAKRARGAPAGGKSNEPPPGSNDTTESSEG